MTTVDRVKSRYVEPVKTGFRFRDFLVILFCLFIFVYCINLFRLDLFHTINLQNVEPVGTITIRNNTVQRRIADRVIWDRLVIESPVYLGDIIRVAEMSSATLNIDGQQLDIGENTLIRIQLAPNGEGIQIELSEGSVGITVTEESVSQGAAPLQLNMNGRIIETTAGASITASASNEGTAVQVNEGSVVFIEGNTVIEIAEGEQLAHNNAGVEVLLPSVVVTQPHPNARFVKSAAQDVPVNFSWNRINLQPHELIRLELAADRNFSRNVKVYDDLNTSLATTLDAGNWNWRFVYQDTILSTGRVTVIETNLELQSPARGSLFRYETELPSIRFQWSEIEEASHYIIEVSSALNFENPQITRQTSASFFVDTLQRDRTQSDPAQRWFWRVKPVFSSSYTGNADYSQVSFFIIEQSAVTAEVTILEREQTAEIQQIISLSETIPETLPVQPEAAESSVRQEIQEIAEAVPEPPPPPPPPPFSIPANRLPANGQVYRIEQLRAQRNIVFSWSQVQGANAYIIIVLERTSTGQRVISRETVTEARWTLDNLSLLGRGTFYWQVEAIYRNVSGEITRRGRTGENSFSVDVPSPRPVQMDSPGVLYGQ